MCMLEMPFKLVILYNNIIVCHKNPNNCPGNGYTDTTANTYVYHLLGMIS